MAEEGVGVLVTPGDSEALESVSAKSIRDKFILSVWNVTISISLGARNRVITPSELIGALGLSWLPRRLPLTTNSNKMRN